MSQTFDPLTYALQGSIAKRINRRKRRVVFLVHAPETFTAIEGVIAELQRRADRFELIFFAVPRNYTGKAGPCEGADVTRAFLAGKGLEAMELAGDKAEDLLELIRLAPDFLFRQSPWEHHLPKYFNSAFLAFANLCYVPYGLAAVEEPRRQYNQAFHNACELIFCETEFHLGEFRRHRRHGTRGVHLTGHPRFEALLGVIESGARSWPVAGAGDLPRVIWAPHHTITRDWLGYSTFLTFKDAMLAEARRGRLSLLFRPHPALEEKLVVNQAMSAADYQAYQAAFDATGTSGTDRNLEYLGTFAASDAMITDGLGFLAEYQLAGKPLFRTVRADSAPLNEFNRLLVAGLPAVSTVPELTQLLDALAARQSFPPPPQAHLLREVCRGASRRIADVLEQF